MTPHEGRIIALADGKEQIDRISKAIKASIDNGESFIPINVGCLKKDALKWLNENGYKVVDTNFYENQVFNYPYSGVIIW
jgi:hypothetical protein